jgi:type II secretory pathway pseudopilin PulG
MGQQQLLLIVLGVIIVGIAIVVGINLFSASSLEANRDGVVSDNMNLAALAQQFYKKPTSLGGGNNTFTGFTIPTNLASTANGTYAAVVAAQSVVLTGTGVVTNSAGKKYVAVTTVAPATITTAVPTLQ